MMIEAQIRQLGYRKRARNQFEETVKIIVRTKKVYASARPKRYQKQHFQSKSGNSKQGFPPKKGSKDDRSRPVAYASSDWNAILHIDDDKNIYLKGGSLSSADRKALGRASRIAEYGNTRLAEDIISTLNAKHPLDFMIILHHAEILDASRGTRAMVAFLDRIYASFKQALSKIPSNGEHYRVPYHDPNNKLFLEFLELLGLKLWETGNVAKALDVLFELLKLNPDDNMGIRESVLHVALKLNRFNVAKEIPKIIKGPDREAAPKPEQDLATMIYGWGLYYFKQDDKKRAKEVLAKAINANPFVIQYLKGDYSIRPSERALLDQDCTVSGGQSEAIKYFLRWRSVWEDDAQALKFLFSVAKEVDYATILKAKEKRLNDIDKILDGFHFHPGTRITDEGTTIENLDDDDYEENVDPAIRSIHNFIQAGDSPSIKDGSFERVKNYLKAWTLIKQAIHEHSDDWRIVDQLLTALDIDLITYCSEFMMELHNAGLDNEAYFPKIIEIGNEILVLLKAHDDNFAFNMKRDIAEAYFHLGDAQTGNEQFELLTRQFPDEIGGYIGWGDQLAGDPTDPCYDYAKAENLYQKALELMILQGKKDDEDLSIRFDDLYDNAETPEKLYLVLEKMKEHGIMSRIL